MGADKSGQEGDRERLLRRATEAREYASRVDPSLLDSRGIDLTLHDLTMSRSVLERLDDAYHHELGNGWLRELRRAHPSGRR
jgi:hypothetical protein